MEFMKDDDSFMQDEVFKTAQIVSHSKFNYETGDNHIKVEILKCENNKVALDALIPLDEVTF